MISGLINQSKPDIWLKCANAIDFKNGGINISTDANFRRQMLTKTLGVNRALKLSLRSYKRSRCSRPSFLELQILWDKLIFRQNNQLVHILSMSLTLGYISFACFCERPNWYNIVSIESDHMKWIVVTSKLPDTMSVLMSVSLSVNRSS